MSTKIYCIGKIKDKYLQEGIAYFTKDSNIKIIEVDDEKAPEKLSHKEMENIKKIEGEKLLSKIGEDEFLIALAIDGKKVGKEELEILVKNHKNLSFVIGGSLGLSNEILKRANYKISFSNMTFTHQMMRFILVESLSSLR